MSAWLTEQERQQAIAVLSRLPTATLRAAANREVERLVMQAEHTTGHYRSRVDDADLPAFLVDAGGVDLFAGTDQGRRLRAALAETLDDTTLARVHAYQPGVSPAYSRNARLREVVERKWSPGKRWPRCFVEAVGLPLAFAGVEGIREGPATEEIRPYRPLPGLHPYQFDLVERVLRLLDGPPTANRGLLSLPTGAGKTRTAVDALIRWWAAGDLERGCMLWIAQSDELCEQAVQSFRDAWVDRGHTDEERRSLILHRLWAGRAFPELPTGVVVASIQKLQSGLTSSSSDARQGFESLVAATRAVVVDEAHHTTATIYRQVLGRLGVSLRETGSSEVPFLGLTATPYRGSGVTENQDLARAFGRNLVVPPKVRDPIAELRADGVLSHAKHEPLATDRSFSLTPAEEQQLGTFQRLPESFLHRVAKDARRNHLILERLLGIPSGTPTLFFGCSVDHATATAVLLRRQGRSAAAVSAETRPATRRFLIEEFRQGHLQVLCNYGVLTTGFDAPIVEAVMIARPTTSPVLYEQMIGRGMRGPKNGGTPECRVIDLVDHIAKFGGQMAYTRFAEYWT